MGMCSQVVAFLPTGARLPSLVCAEVLGAEAARAVGVEVAAVQRDCQHRAGAPLAPLYRHSPLQPKSPRPKQSLCSHPRLLHLVPHRAHLHSCNLSAVSTLARPMVSDKLSPSGLSPWSCPVQHDHGDPPDDRLVS